MSNLQSGIIGIDFATTINIWTMNYNKFENNILIISMNHRELEVGCYGVSIKATFPSTFTTLTMYLQPFHMATTVVVVATVIL